MADPEERPYIQVDGQWMPYLPIALRRDGRVVEVNGLVDSGSAANILPYSVGAQLGGVWERQRVTIDLGGVIRGAEARGLLVEAVVGGFAPVTLAFAWIRTDETPVILGQTNFFAEFDVCLHRARLVFTIRPKQEGPTAS